MQFTDVLSCLLCCTCLCIVLQIPYVVIAEQAKILYKKTLETYTDANPIITVEHKDTLDKMAAFLSMDSAAVADIHSEVN